MGIDPNTTVGYKYYFGVATVHVRQHDAMISVEMNGKQTFKSYIKDGTFRAARPDLFGGQEREGGFTGKLSVNAGEPDQFINDYLRGAKNTLTSALRGCVSVIWEQCYWSANTARMPTLRTKHVNTEGVSPGWLPDLKRMNDVYSLQNCNISFAIDRHRRVDFLSIFRCQDAIVQLCESQKNTATSYNTNIRITAPKLIVVPQEPFGNLAIEVLNVQFKKEVRQESDWQEVIDWVQENIVKAELNSSLETWVIGDLFAFFTSLSQAEYDAQKVVEAFFGGDPLATDRDCYQFWIQSRPTKEGLDIFGLRRLLQAQGNLTVTNISIKDVFGDYPASTELAVVDINGTGVLEAGTDNDQLNDYRDGIRNPFLVWTDLNPAHIIRDLWTNPLRGGSVDVSEIGDSFATEAQRYFDEGISLSCKFRGIDGPDVDRAEVERHIDAISYRSNVTGKIELVSIRDDYDVNTLRILDNDIVTDWSGLSRPRKSEVPNQLTVVYTKRDGKKGSVTRTNVAGVRRSGRLIKGAKVFYPWFTLESLAVRACLRDLRTVSADVLSGTIPLTYLPADIEPGTVVILNNPLLGINNLPCRVTETRIGQHDDSTASITIIEDKYGTTQAVDAEETNITIDGGPASIPGDLSNLPENIFDIDGSSRPVDASPQLITEASYFQGALTLGQDTVDQQLASEPDLGRLYVAGGRGNVNQVSLVSALAPVGSDLFEQGKEVSFSPKGVLLNPLSSDPTVTDFLVAFDGSQQEIRPNDIAVLGEEIIVITNMVDNEDGTVTVTAKRGCLDGPPVQHKSGSGFLLVNNTAVSKVDYIAGQALQVRLLSRTGSRLQANSEVTPTTLTFDSRAIRPYPVGQYQIEGSYTPLQSGSIGGTATWVHRDRTLQTTLDVDGHLAGTIGPETNTTYIPVVRTYPRRLDLFAPADFFQPGDFFADLSDVTETIFDPIGQVTTYDFEVKQTDFFAYTDVFAQADFFQTLLPADTQLVGAIIRSSRDGYDNFRETELRYVPLLPPELTVENVFTPTPPPRLNFVPLGSTGVTMADGETLTVLETPIAPQAISARYWRLFCRKSQSGIDPISLSGLQMFRNVADPLDLISGRGAQVIASTEFDGTTLAANAVDGDGATAWVADTATNEWIGFDFGAPATVQEVSVQTRGSTFFDQTPDDLRVDYSDDGVSWTTAWDIGQIKGAWTATQTTQKYADPDAVDDAALTAQDDARYWRVLILTNQGGGTPAASSASDIEFRDEFGGPDRTGAGVAIASSEFSASFPASQAFNGNTADFWVSEDANYGTQWIGYDFGEGELFNIVDCAYTIRSDSFGAAEAPVTGIIQLSNDLVNWDDAFAFETTPDWLNNTAEKRILS